MVRAILSRRELPSERLGKSLTKLKQMDLFVTANQKSPRNRTGLDAQDQAFRINQLREEPTISWAMSTTRFAMSMYS